jgi:two-component system LytT family response regulator
MNETDEIITQDMNLKMEKALLEAYGKISYETKKIPLSTNDGIWMMKVKDIYRIEGEGNYSKFFFTNGETLLISKTLKDYEKILSEYKFERIHKSHLVNLNYITKYYKNEGSYVLMEDGTEITVARNKRERLMLRLELL